MLHKVEKVYPHGESGLNTGVKLRHTNTHKTHIGYPHYATHTKTVKHLGDKFENYKL